MQKRLIAILILFTILFLGITSKTFYEQVVMGPIYAHKSLEIRTKQFPAEEYIRGDILDCNGISLTDAAYRPTIVLFPRLIHNAASFIEKVNKQLPELNLNFKDIKPCYRNGSKIYPDPFIINLNKNSNYSEIISSWNEPGIAVLPIKIRYGSNSLAVHIIGHMEEKDCEAKGNKGIEKSFDQKLRGSRPEKVVTPITDARNNILMGLGYRNIDLGQDPKRNDVILTIDSRIQRIVEEVMDEKGIIKGGVVVLDINTGSILAAASRPIFDQNNPNETMGFNDNQIERTIDYQVYPGSIFKVITAAAALEEGIVTPDTKFVCTGSSPDFHVTCPREHGELTFSEAMERSCNVTFVQVGLQLGREKLKKYIIEDFGLKLVKNKSLNSTGAEANAIIGQEIFKASPLEIANMMATIARDGYHQKLPEKWENRLRTRLVKAFKNIDNLENITEIPEFHQIYSKQTAQQLKTMLIATNKWGSGKRAWVEEYGSAGKTGTPECDKDGEYMAWYAGYAPLKKPKLAVAVLIEEIDNLDKADLQGGRHAAPVFKEIVERTLKLGL